jgi:hypothetical protein
VPTSERDRCAAPPGISNAPATLSDAISLLNALPKPVTLACFVESLARPLHANATSSPFSAQPASGKGNPRIFLFSGETLILSVVPAGVGRDLLELSQLTSVNRSVKAEIPFPVTEDVTDEALVEQIARGGGSVCALCHASEIPASGSDFFDGALESEALRPVPDYDVELSTLLVETEQCDRTFDPVRCELLDALFTPGDVVHRVFPEAMRTFF